MIRALFVVVVGAAVLAVVGVVVGSRHHSLDFDGGSFSTWAKRTGPDSRVEESVALEGPRLIPELVELVDWNPSSSEEGARKFHDWLPESWQPDFRVLRVTDPEELRPRVIRLLGQFGLEASSALPSVLAWTSDPGAAGQEALVAALRIAPGSPEVAAKVVSALSGDDPVAQRVAAAAIWETGVPVDGGLPSLRLKLTGPERPAPEFIGAVGIYGNLAVQAVPRLAPWLEVPELKRLVLQTLRQIGPSSAVALTEIRRDLNPDSPALVDALALAGVLGPAGAGAVPELKALEKHPASLVRVLTAAALASVSGSVTNAVRVLTEELQFQVPDRTLVYRADHPMIRDLVLSPAEAAAWQLGVLGRSAKSAVPGLVTALDADDLRLATFAAWALWRITGESEMVVPALRRGLAFAADPDTQRVALGAISELGPLAALVANDLGEVTFLRLDVRRAAREQLELIRVQSPEPVLP